MTSDAAHNVDEVSPAIEVTDDLFLGGALRVRQPKRGYRAGLDAVLLAAACPVLSEHRTRCLDCGAGAGVAGLSVAHRIGNLSVSFVERDAELADLAMHNIAVNGLSERCNVVRADLTRPLSQLAALSADAGCFDHVLANPPFHAHGEGTRAADRHKDGSHAMQAGTFEAWARFAASMARNGGSFTIIQRPDALPEILAALSRRFGRVKILPLHSRDGQPASRVLIQAIKGSRAALQILPGRTLHLHGSHVFTPAFDAILRLGAALEL